MRYLRDDEPLDARLRAFVYETEWISKELWRVSRSCGADSVAQARKTADALVEQLKLAHEQAARTMIALDKPPPPRFTLPEPWQQWGWPRMDP